MITLTLLLAFQTSGLDLADLDRTVQPCEDFYRFANGGWADRTPLLPEYPSWNAFTEVRERNNELLRKILEELSADETSASGSDRRKLADFWCGCMDEEQIERLGAQPLQPLFRRLDGLRSLADLRAAVGWLHRQGSGPLFAFWSEQDSRDATRYIAAAYQGGLGMPDRDYYTRGDAASIELRDQYVAHVARMLELAGAPADVAVAQAAVVMDIETRLAQASMTRVEQRDPNAIYHLMSVDEADDLSPRWSWRQYLGAVGSPTVAELNVAQPEFFKRMDELLASVPLDDWRVYLRWHVVHDFAPALSSAFVNENFAFYGTTLSGTKEIRPRWKRCLSATDGALGEALGQEYVARAFSPTAKARAQQMVANVMDALRERLATREWMSSETRQAALGKLDTFVTKIGYPDVWRDYSSLRVDREAGYAGNLMAAQEFEFRRTLARIGKPIDRGEWGMSPPTVNAYYNPSMNEIVFPAGIMQPPYFSETYDDALNYGAMGAVIGHEITHGFDDQGSQFDPQGNLREWWPAADREEFERRAGMVAAQYDGYVAIDDLHVNGSLTLGENIADFGGLTISYYALQKALAGRPAVQLDGFSPEQRFFLAWARAWRNLCTPEFLRLMVNTNEHAPGRFRAIGPLQIMPEFARAFGCSGEAAMVRSEEQRALIW